MHARRVLLHPLVLEGAHEDLHEEQDARLKRLAWVRGTRQGQTASALCAGTWAEENRPGAGRAEDHAPDTLGWDQTAAAGAAKAVR